MFFTGHLEEVNLVQPALEWEENGENGRSLKNLEN